MTSLESQLESQFLQKPVNLKYVHRGDTRDRAALEKSFRENFNTLNHVRLTDAKFGRLLDKLVTPDVFTATNTLRNRNSFMREDDTPLNYTLVNIDSLCKNSSEVVSQLWGRLRLSPSSIRRDDPHQRRPMAQVEHNSLAINPRRTIEQIVDYANDTLTESFPVLRTLRL